VPSKDVCTSFTWESDSVEFTAVCIDCESVSTSMADQCVSVTRSMLLQILLIAIHSLVHLSLSVYPSRSIAWGDLKYPTIFRKDERITSWSIFRWRNQSFWDLMIQDDLSFAYFSINSSIFPYYDTALAAKYRSFSQSYYQTINMSRSEARQRFRESQYLDNEPLGPYIYYSGNIWQNIFRNVVKDVDLSTLVDSSIFNSITALIWMGTAHVIASPHYDSVNNIYIQLHGKKRFRLRPPADVEDLEVYGRYHPYACQTRLVSLNYTVSSQRRYFTGREFRMLADYFLMDGSCLNDDPRSLSHDEVDGVMEFNLDPGDILYIPAYWFHEVN
jgi:hypothetical protein